MFFGGCPGKCAAFVHENACLLPVLHAVKVALAVFYQQKIYLPVFTFIIRCMKVLGRCSLTYFCVAVRLQPSPCLNFDFFLSFNAYKLTMYQHLQQKYKQMYI
jgi:hypothetical protein